MKQKQNNEKLGKYSAEFRIQLETEGFMPVASGKKNENDFYSFKNGEKFLDVYFSASKAFTQFAISKNEEGKWTEYPYDVDTVKRLIDRVEKFEN